MITNQMKRHVTHVLFGVAVGIVDNEGFQDDGTDIVIGAGAAALNSGVETVVWQVMLTAYVESGDSEKLFYAFVLVN